VGSGYCRDVVYHQYKSQFAVIVGFDAKDRQIEYREVREKRGILKYEGTNAGNKRKYGWSSQGNQCATASRSTRR
jgi:hypothetical protein